MTLPSLDGRHILVVEDEFFVALDLEQSLQDAGATVVGPAPTVADALALIEGEPALDAAVLDVNLGGEMAFSLADRLLAEGVPLVLSTGYNQADLPARLSHVPRLEKPIDPDQVTQEIRRFIQARPA